jgi:hypothetical protein
MNYYSNSADVPTFNNGRGTPQDYSQPSYGAAPEESWATTNIEVQVVSSNGQKFSDGIHDSVHGVIRELETPTRVVVKLFNGETVTIPLQFLKTVPPQKRDRVKIISGENKNEIGSFLSTSNEDAVVKLPSSALKVIPMKSIAKYVE